MAYQNAAGINVTGIVTLSSSGSPTGSSVTQYGTVVAGTNNTVSSVAPSAGSGIPLISMGSSANPAFGTAVVAGGGTGNTTFTAYSVICAGTTATGVFQNVSGVGSSGQVLTSNGASALPTWQAAGGGITTLAGDSGSATGSTVTVTTGAGDNSGATLNFSGSSSTLTFNTSDGNGNTCVGQGSNGTGGSANASFGVSCGANYSGTGGVAIGFQALNASCSTNGIVAIGYRNLKIVTGASNTAVGYSCGYNAGPGLQSGTYNALYGYQAGKNYTDPESSNICINSPGVNAESNALHIGAGTGTGNQQLSSAFISGINGVATGTTAVGITSGDQLTAGGVLTNTSQPAFLALLSTDVTNATGGGSTYSLGGTTTALTEVFDQGSNFDPGNGSGTGATFTAPVTGIYQFFANIGIIAAGGATSSRVDLILTGITYNPCQLNPTACFDAIAGRLQYPFSILVKMTAGDTATINFIAAGGTDTMTIASSSADGQKTYWGGNLLC